MVLFPDTEAYELTGGLFATYGFEYKPGIYPPLPDCSLMMN